MSRGKKLDLFIGADFDDTWTELKSDTQKKEQQAPLQTPKQHQLHFTKEKRRGKTLTLVGPFSIAQEDAQTLLKSFKKTLGCGGSYKNDFMEFQGDIKERLRPLLVKEGFSFKAKH
jgi:translation initiation factor 1